jgi:hypothetical protein
MQDAGGYIVSQQALQANRKVVGEERKKQKNKKKTLPPTRTCVVLYDSI